MKELPIRSLPGIPVLIAALLAGAAAAWLFFTGVGGTAHGGGALPVESVTDVTSG